MLERFTRGELSARFDDEVDGGDRAASQARLVQVGILLLVVSACAVFSGGKPRIGLNAFTAQAAVAGASVVGILSSIRKLT